MTQDEIIRMAREAGFTELDLSQGRADILKDFAALVAAHEQDKFCSMLRQFHDSISLASIPRLK